MRTVCWRREGAGPTGGVACGCPADGVARGALKGKDTVMKGVKLLYKRHQGGSTYHTAAGVAGVLQVVVQQFGGSILERLRERPQQHGELWGVELKQSYQHHLGRLMDETRFSCV